MEFIHLFLRTTSMVNTFNAARGSLEAAAYGPLKWIDCFNNRRRSTASATRHALSERRCYAMLDDIPVAA